MPEQPDVETRGGEGPDDWKVAPRRVVYPVDVSSAQDNYGGVLAVIRTCGWDEEPAGD